MQIAKSIVLKKQKAKGKQTQAFVMDTAKKSKLITADFEVLSKVIDNKEIANPLGSDRIPLDLLVYQMNAPTTGSPDSFLFAYGERNQSCHPSVRLVHL
jgi:hypothetical protein